MNYVLVRISGAAQDFLPASFPEQKHFRPLSVKPQALGAFGAEIIKAARQVNQKVTSTHSGTNLAGSAALSSTMTP